MSASIPVMFSYSQWILTVTLLVHPFKKVMFSMLTQSHQYKIKLISWYVGGIHYGLQYIYNPFSGLKELHERSVIAYKSKNSVIRKTY